MPVLQGVCTPCQVGLGSRNRVTNGCRPSEELCRDTDDFTLLHNHVSATQQKLTKQADYLGRLAELQSSSGRQAVLPCDPQQQLAPSRQQQLPSTFSDAQQTLDKDTPSRVQHNSLKQHNSQHCGVQVDYAYNTVASPPQVILKRISDETAPSSSELQVLQWPILKPKHITNQLVILRRLALANMQDGPSAQKAFSKYTVQINVWLDNHHALCNSIVLSTALLSLAHLTQRVETLGITLNPSVVETAHKLLGLAVAKQHMADSQSISNVFWALARLNISPASVKPEYEASMAQAYLAAPHSSILGVSNMLWALSSLRINPLKGKLLGHLIQRTEECIADPALIPSQYLQCFSTIMWVFGTLGLFVKPALAEHLVSKFHEGIMQGIDDPVSIGSMMWALTCLGYAPPAQVLDDFKAASHRQLYQSLQTLQPKSLEDPSCSQWQQATQFVQETWPLQLSPAEPQSYLGAGVYHTLLQMGYQAIEHHDSGDGLHEIDVALLPQKGLPFKVAVEADGPVHYLYEDCRLQASLQPATRPNGATLFRNAVLRKQGWTVLSIPYFEWDFVKHAARPKYLAEKLRQLLQEQS